MNSDQLFPKDFRVKYSSLSSIDHNRKHLDDLKISVDISQEELRAAREAAHVERKRSQDLHTQVLAYKEKVESLEKHISILNELIKDKDKIVGKLWDELLNGRKHIEIDINHRQVLKDIEEENEICEEGHAADIHRAVGKDSASRHTEIKFTQDQKQIKMLREQLAVSQDSNKMINDRMRDINESYVKLEIENKELREKVKILSENSVIMTQQLVRISDENDKRWAKVMEENQELGKKLGVSESERYKEDMNNKAIVHEISIELEHCREKLQKANSDKQQMINHNQEIREENKNLVDSLKKKNEEIKDIMSKSHSKANDIALEKQLEFENLLKENADLKHTIREMKTI